jgi:hypothetical protein
MRLITYAYVLAVGREGTQIIQEIQSINRLMCLCREENTGSFFSS